MPNTALSDGGPDPEKINSREEFAAALTVVRERAGLTVRDVARAVQVPFSTLGGYFGGRHLPPVSQTLLLTELLRACGVTEQRTIDAWNDALARLRRQPGPRPATAPAPYRGLARFDTEHAEWFFGRRHLTKLLVDRVRAGLEMESPLVVVGPSGSGKSSLLRAGLIPAIGHGGLDMPGSERWPAAVVVPGGHPLQALADALDDRAIVDSGRWVLIVDQLEEVFAPSVDAGERAAFLAKLSTLAASGPVILGLRADFYAIALRDPILAPHLQLAQLVVPPMTKAELRDAIVQPARKANVELERGLVELLIADVQPAANRGGEAAHDAGTLPFVSHALWATWQRGQRRQLTVAHYGEIGGIRGAIAQTAEDVFGSLSPAHQNLARQLLLRMVLVTDDAPDTRRRVPYGELELHAADVQEILDRFIAHRLVTATSEWLEITHEALIAVWPRLRSWIDVDRAGLRTHRQLTEAALIWQRSRNDPHTLYRGSRLALATEWSRGPRHEVNLNPLERQFLQASDDHDLSEIRVTRRRNRRLIQLLAAASVLLVLTGVLAVVAMQQRRIADEQRDLAVSRQLAITANQLRSNDPALAMQLSLAAFRTAPTPEARASLLDAVAGPDVTRLLGTPGVLQSVDFAHEGRLMAAGGADAAIRLWTRDGDRPPRSAGAPLTGHRDTIFSVAFSPDGRTLASGSGDRSIRLWNVADPTRSTAYQHVAMPTGNTVYAVTFSPDGRTLASASADGLVRLWNVADPTRPALVGAPLRGSATAVHTVSFSPDGHLLAAAGAAGGLQLWDVSAVNHPVALGQPLRGPTRTIFTVAFSPDGQTLAAGSADSSVWLWTVAKPSAPQALGSLKGPTSWVNSVSWSPDGRTLAGASSDGKTWLWDLATRSVTGTLPHPGPITSVKYLNDTAIGTGAADGTARLWNTASPMITGFAGDVFTISFAAGNHIVAVSSIDNTAGLWSVANPRAPAKLGVKATEATRSGRASGAAALSPDARTLAVGAVDGSIQLWNFADPNRPAPTTRLRGPSANIQGITFSPDGRLLIAGSDDNKVWLWDLPDGSGRPLAGHTNYAYGPALSPDGRLLAAGGADNTVRLWQLDDPDSPRTVTPPLAKHTNYVFATAFSPDGSILATGSADNTVRLWDVTDPAHPKPIGNPLTGPTNYVYSLAFAPSGHTLAAGAGDGRVWLWDLTQRQRPTLLAALAAYGGPVFAVAFDPQNGTLAAGGDQKIVRFWNIDPAAIAAHICATTGSAITTAEWAQYATDLPYRPPC